MSLLVKSGLVTTIIPVFNRPTLVVEAVHSVLAQTYQNIEIIVVDDGSTDETPTVLAELAQEKPRLNVFSQPNSGPGVARELGRLNARGEFIQYLDSDDLLLPTKFESQVAALMNQTTADVAYGKTEQIKFGQPQNGVAHRRTGVKQASMFPSLLRERWWFTSTPLYRRSVVEQTGPWTSMMNEEDWEYDCRVASFGGRLAFVDEFVSLHRSHEEHLSAEGASDPEKLKHRAMSRAKMFQHAKRYAERDDTPAEIKQDDWALFSKYAFLLARQCALAGLTTEARAMTSVSIEARGRKSAQHILFLKLVKFLGWKNAAKAVKLTGR